MKNIGISKGIMVMNLLYLDNYLVFADASENNKWKQNLRFEELQRLTSLVIPTISFKTNWDTYSLCIISCVVQFLSHISPLAGPLPDQCCCAVYRNCSSFK